MVCCAGCRGKLISALEREKSVPQGGAFERGSSVGYEDSGLLECPSPPEADGTGTFPESFGGGQVVAAECSCGGIERTAVQGGRRAWAR